LVSTSNPAEIPINLLTGNHTDPVTHTPAFKETVVRMRVLSEKSEIPLPRINHRFGHPTPQQGIEVERKWRQPRYHVPGNGPVQIQTEAKHA
jgi:formate dehydrogenase major subunit